MGKTKQLMEAIEHADMLMSIGFDGDEYLNRVYSDCVSFLDIIEKDHLDMYTIHRYVHEANKIKSDDEKQAAIDVIEFVFDKLDKDVLFQEYPDVSDCEDIAHEQKLEYTNEVRSYVNQM